MFDIPCVIFAGGKSSRMGEDKALLPFSTFSTLTEYQYSRLSKLFTDVYISTKEREKFNFNANFILDESSKESIYAPTAGFIAAFKAIETQKIFVISVDSPFVDSKEITQLLMADTNDFDATIARTKSGIQPMCGIYHATLLNSFLTMRDNETHKLGYLLKNSSTQYVDFEDEKAFLNLNHPHEYQEALDLLNS
jgi:molybdopterin-guanine dinucleotide biosynthesis protein A